MDPHRRTRRRGMPLGIPPHGRSPHGPINLPDITVDEDTPQPYRVFHAMRRVMVAQKQLMTRKLGEKDAHFGQAFSLWVLSEHEGMSQSDLAGTLNVARPTVTVMLKRMERAGLIERRADEQDQRYVRIYLTPAGRALHGELEAVIAEVVGATVGSMSEEEQRELERLLCVVEDNVTSAE